MSRTTRGAKVDPLGGSWLVEELTDRIEAEALALIERIDLVGGMVRAVAGVYREVFGAYRDPGGY